MLAFLDFCRCLTVPQLIARKYNFYKTGRRDSKGGCSCVEGVGVQTRENAKHLSGIVFIE